MYIHKTPPTPSQNTPFSGLNLKVGKRNYRLGNLDPNWAKCLKSGQNFSRSGQKKFIHRTHVLTSQDLSALLTRSDLHFASSRHNQGLRQLGASGWVGPQLSLTLLHANASSAACCNRDSQGIHGCRQCQLQQRQAGAAVTVSDSGPPADLGLSDGPGRVGVSSAGPIWQSQ